MPEAQEAQAAPDQPKPEMMTLPAKGSTMSDVKKKFGDPRDQKPPVGGDTPKHPPITRWDYESFVVIFEKDRVIDAVVPGAPAKLRTTSGLTPAPGAPPLPDTPAPMETPAEPAPPAEPIVPETPPAEPAPPMEPAAAAAPTDSPPPDQPPPATEPPPAEKMEPAPVESPVPSSDGPPTPK